MNIVFLGSPDFAVPSLIALDQNFHVSGVITQPDRPAGRGRQLRYPAVKQTAMELGLPILQPNRISDASVLEALHNWQPDVIAVAAYGQILPPDLLSFPPHGSVNVHASLLPRWRGAAPIQAAILHGDEETGVTTMLMDAGLDTGPILTQQRVTIQEQETGGQLFNRLAPIGADLLASTLPTYLSGELKPIPQDDALATYAPMLSKADGRLDFSKKVRLLNRQIRAFNPWPGSFFYFDGRRHIVYKASPVLDKPAGAPGTALNWKSYPAIACTDGLLVLKKLQPAGKKPMDGADFLNGAQHFAGSVIDSEQPT